MSRERSILILLFIMATAMNIGKAFHIDDPFHVHAAMWIAQEPLRPMSGTVNWSGSVEHFHQGNQPPLFFYAMALWGPVFGFAELSMHTLLALFTALAIFFFHRLAKLIHPESALYLTALLVLGPAFLVNQNVMLEIPLVAMICAMLYFLCRGIMHDQRNDLLIAALWLSAAILIKYTALALLPVLLAAVWFQGQRSWWVASVPIAVLTIWSLWNLAEFGAIHLLSRSTRPPGVDPLPGRVISWLMTLGSIAPWLGLVWIHGLFSQRSAPPIAWGVFLSVALFMALAVFAAINPPIPDRVLGLLFILNGVAGVWTLVLSAKHLIQDKVKLLLVLAIACLGTFVILFAPWMATRHLLLILPMMLLAMAPLIARMSIGIRRAMLIATAMLGILLGISDRRFAAFYKNEAHDIILRYPEDRIWFVGSLGWGWYAQKAGMIDLASSTVLPAPDDLIAVPLDFATVPIPEQIHTEEVEVIEQPLGLLDRFSTRTWLRFYSARYPDLPWTITQAQPERLLLLRVVSKPVEQVE